MSGDRRPRAEEPSGRALAARALEFERPGSVCVRKLSLEPAPGELIVESRFMAISHGTEMLAFRGELPGGIALDESLPLLSGPVQYPLRYGYSNAGVTDAGRRVFAFAPHQDRFVAAPEALIELPDDVDFRDAVFLPNLETALSIVQDVAPRVGDVVLVVGQGVVGLLVAELLVRRAHADVITVDRLERRVRASEAIGCRALRADAPKLAEAIFEHTAGRGADLAVNVSGSAEGLQLAIDTLAFSGSVVEASWYGARPVTVALGTAFHRRRLSIRSSQVSTVAPNLSGRWSKRRRIEAALELVAAIRPSRYITHTFALEQGQSAFDLIARHPEETIQVCLTP